MRHCVGLILFGLLACSCVEYVNLNTEDPREVVVGCVLRDTAVQELELSWTLRNEDSGAPERILEAEVVLSAVTSGGTQEVGHFSCGTDGIWRLPFRPEAGESYRLDITADGQAVSAETRMPYGFLCRTVPNPALIVYPWDVKKHIYPSRQVSAEDADRCTIVAWFSGRDGIVKDVVSSHEKTDSFNASSSGVRFLLGYEIVEMGGASFLAAKPADKIEESDYVHRPFYDRMAIIATAAGDENCYFFPAEEPAFSSSRRDFDVLNTLKRHPEYGAYEKDWVLWGPNFDVWPAPDEQASVLHILRPSEELLAYMKSVVSLTSSSGAPDITQVWTQKSPYTNIRGGRGIFGAAAEYTEDYTDYDERMTAYYQTLHDNEVRSTQP